MRDPYYRKILEGLAGPLDPDAFEECVVDLLREAYPGLVPIPGGQDAGMDGAVADGVREAFPLVVTTQADVIGNLTRSLDSYTEGGGSRRKVVLATSQALTPVRRRNLERRAREMDFTLVQIHEQRDIASRLYRNFAWAFELLKVPGEPPALSSIPASRRPLRENIELIGRDEDLAWLRESTGDRLIVGQPGSGKTHLLLQLAVQGEALFLVSEDERRIAEDWRDLQPEIIILDDAHLDPERATRLRHIRTQIGADFDIIATGWPGFEDDIGDALGIGSDEGVRKLELLTRKQVVEVLRAIGIQAPEDDPYLRLLVDQSANKPGLAVTLGSLWLRGDWPDLLTGRALRRSLIPSLKRVLENDPTRILACFALGGDGGMSTEVVRAFLGLDRESLYHRATVASHGGVLEVLDSEHLAVQPKFLRFALIHEVFFASAPLPFRELLGQAPKIGDALETLIGCAHQGVSVPVAALRELVVAYGSQQAWGGLAALGEAESRWVMEHYQENFEEIAGAVLHAAPGAAIRRLLGAAEAAEGPLHSNPSHPLRILEDWVQEISFLPGQEDVVDVGEIVRRRRLVVETTLSFLQAGGDRTIGLRACFIALKAVLESARETVTGNAVTVRRGLLPSSAVPALLQLWSEVYELTGELSQEAWAQLEETLWEWVYPTNSVPDLPETASENMRSVAARMITDLQRRSENRPGFQWALAKWAFRAGTKLDLEVDEDFQILFPSEEHMTAENWEEEQEKQHRAARQLARRWSARPPDAIVERLAFYDEEARLFGHGTSTMPGVACRTLAELAGAPDEWLDALVRHELPPDWIGYFLERVVRERRPNWEDMVARCLSAERYAWLAAFELLQTENVPFRLLELALEKIPPHLVETACQRGQVPLITLGTLLQSPRHEVALAAAVGEWLAEPKGQVRPSVEEKWREVILRTGTGGAIDDRNRHGTIFWLKQILQSDADLAFGWLQGRLEDVRDFEVVSPDGVYVSATRALNVDQRRQLLTALKPSFFAGQLLHLLVGSSVDLYRLILGREELKTYHLVPLGTREPPEQAWVQLARVALEAGYQPARIAQAAFETLQIISGFGSEYWMKRKAAFGIMLKDSDGALREVAEAGRDIAQRAIERSEAKKREFELTGRF